MHVPPAVLSPVCSFGPGTATLDWQIGLVLSAAGLKWCGSVRIRVLGRTLLGAGLVGYLRACLCAQVLWSICLGTRRPA